MILLVLLLLASTVTGQQLPCGSTPIAQSRVIGGQDAKPGAWPWQIALQRFGRFICGGSLISSTWVVTAAHCVSGSSNAANYKVVVGDHNRNTNEGTEEVVDAKRIISHPNYNNPRLSSDIALIELASPVKLSQRVNPICIPSHDSDVPTGSRCFITGWGKIKHPGSSYHILQQAMMPVIDNNKCKQKIQASGVSISLTPQMLCAGVENTILSGCHGDSGGPYVCLNADGKTYTLHGAVSWGSGQCNARQLFTVFARVTQFRAWIKQHTGIGGGGGGGGGSPPPPPSPPVPTTPGKIAFECSFDKDLCGFSQSSSDKFDWTRKSGGTSSSSTGPSGDVSGQGSYMYIETSSPRVQGDNAKLMKSGLSFNNKMRLSFSYHMYGNTMGTLNVYVGQKKIFTKSGNQGNQWNQASVDVTEPGASELIFEGIRGSSYTGDAAIDNVKLEEIGGGGGGGGGGCGSTVSPPATAAPPPAVVSCNFDNDVCGFVQDSNDKFDWTRNKGGTGSYQTGPSADHTTGNGYYMYIETSSPRRQGDNAKLNTPKLQFSGNMCMKFYYHMYGASMGTLNVILNGKTVFSAGGNKGNKWLEAAVTVNLSGMYAVTFEGITGSSYQGDIAIDDLMLAPGSCSSITPPPPTTSGPPPPPGSCGIRPHTRIVGGVNAKHGDWPWQVQLRTTSGFPYCGGSLVAPQWILTATHCVRGKSPSSIVIRLGAHRRVSNVGTEQDIKVSKVITHPSYHKPTTYSHDIALLKLEKPAQLNRHVNLVCLPQVVPAPTDGTKCWITGWGRLASGGATPDYLQQVQVPVVSRARCDKSYPGKIHDSMVCAGLDQGGIDSCQGDSGGPMVCETGGKFYVHGATSWGYGCASPGKFGVYAKVKFLLSWINGEMSKN
ncbi:hypothetical protein ACROYT_G008239 [Oculina patagonica]